MTTGALAGITAPADWGWRALWSVAPRIKEIGHPELPPLSVYLDAGVVPRDSRGDNHNQLGEDLSRYLVVQPHDIVFNKLRTWQGGLGVSKYEGIVSPAYFVCRPSEESDARFLHYLLRSKPYLAELTRISKWMPPSQFDTPWDTLRKLPMLLPPLEEQRRIADFLAAETARIDQLTLKRREMRSLLMLKRERLIESTLGLERAQTTDGLVPLKYLVADVTVGIVITPAKWYVEAGGTPALRGLNVKPGFISTGDLVQISAEGHAENRKSRLNTGDVVVVRTGQAGAAAVVPAELDGANCIDLIVVRPGKKLSPRYLQYVLNSDYASARVAEHSVGSIQAHFNVGAMKQIPIPSIPRTEQDEIVRLLDMRVGALDLLHRKLDHQEQLLSERRQALITAAVTGQFDVSSASGRNVTDGVSA
ncbi:restriction endonuclease subunit S [Streptomyces coeruleorubidus]|uniref:restriction endonuclease subunit S n=1 Tax=Streptomyces coeruleorubidus TaxID=116188 RepID=UPI0037BBA838